MDYKNEICNGCNQPFGPDDDIVVCPECGTPQHRSCWNKDGRCVNSHLHSEGFVWQKSIVEPEPEVIEQADRESSAEQKFGASPVFVQLNDEAQNIEGIFLRDQVIHKNETVAGVSVAEAGYYLQSGAHRYIKRFRKNKKLTWNWGAFFFAPAWFFYRKLYKVGAIFLAIVAAIGLFTFSFSQDIIERVDYMYEFTETVIGDENITPEEAEKLVVNEEFMTNYKELVKSFGIYLLITAVIPNLVAALLADFFVKKKMKADIDLIKQTTDDTRTQRAVIISKGGVAPFLFAIVYFINQYLVSILMGVGSVVAEFFN